MDYDDLEIKDYDSYLPNIKQYKYQHLNKYKGDEFINAFVLELIIRIVEINDLITEDMIYENLNFSIINGKLEIADDIDNNQNPTKKNDPLLLNFGITRNYLVNLILMHPYFGGDEKHELTDFNYDFLGDNIIDLKIDLDQSEDELIAMIRKIKRNYEKKIDPFQRLHKDLKKEISNILNSMPETTKVKEQTIIKALFTYDYVRARDKEIDSLNNNPDIIDIENEEKDIAYPSFNPKNYECYFNEDKYKLSGIKPGAGKKLYYYLDPILIKYSTKTI